ncbi:hypothetical protein EJ06DRAFT_585738 [Trichodelitschia bisporula]|uniref:Integral membrane protein n=1 Tax=Trichodelitschia bisporula TaxID=703511 RepID=A0A6G1HIH3_9PEZI|nr:hypothetical protein EJ06DRAFT_585738 [Trichodelitschia bisporula]
MSAKALLAAALIAGPALAQNTTLLPTGTFLASNNSWMVTAPAVWNFATILNATNRADAVTSPLKYLDAHSTENQPYPAPVPYVYVNGSFSSYATNALNYAALRATNVSGVKNLDEAWALPVVCEWPISGTYSRMNRILYYTLLVFALVVHHHEWLVAGALAAATTYSGAAAVQTWVQFGVINRTSDHDSAGDNDNDAILALLSAGLLMAVPLINWSRTLRRLKARPLIIYWAIIIFVGYILVVIGGALSDRAHWSHHDGGIMTCDTRERLPEFKDLGFIDHAFITKYNCDDPCYNAVSHHPLHSSSNTISRVICDTFSWTNGFGYESACFVQCPREIAGSCYVDHAGLTDRAYHVNAVGYYGVLPVAVFELFFVLCFGRMSPEDIRDLMFRFFVGRRLLEFYRSQPQSKRKSAPKTPRVLAAQVGGMAFYIFALLTYLVCLPFFVFNIVWKERQLNFLPDGESPFEVGQWLPWVSVGLTLGAAIVGKYHHAWRIHFLHFVLRHPKPPAPAPLSQAAEKSRTLASWLQRTTWRSRSRIYVEWAAVRDFIRAPFDLVLDDARERTSDHPSVHYAFTAELPYPTRWHRHSKAHFAGPWVPESDWPTFDVEVAMQADERTLRSWERYVAGTGERIVYDVHLPVVPRYPDHRTVDAEADVLVAGKGSVVEGEPRVVYQLRRGKGQSPSMTTVGSGTVGMESLPGDTTVLSKKGTVVIDAQIPPSRMSSIHPPPSRRNTGTEGAAEGDPLIPPVPAVPGTQAGRDTGAEGSDSGRDGRGSDSGESEAGRPVGQRTDSG